MPMQIGVVGKLTFTKVCLFLSFPVVGPNSSWACCIYNLIYLFIFAAHFRTVILDFSHENLSIKITRIYFPKNLNFASLVIFFSYAIFLKIILLASKIELPSRVQLILFLVFHQKRKGWGRKKENTLTLVLG